MPKGVLDIYDVDDEDQDMVDDEEDEKEDEDEDEEDKKDEKEILEEEIPEPVDPLDEDVYADKDINSGQMNQEDLQKHVESSESSEGNFREKEEGEFEDDDRDVKIKKDPEMLGEYDEIIAEDVLTSPDKYQVETSEGVMSLKEAMQKRWDPETDQFGGDIEQEKEELIQELPEDQQEGFRNYVDPSHAQVPIGEAAGMGLEEGNPMIGGGLPEEEDEDELPPMGGLM